MDHPGPTAGLGGLRSLQVTGRLRTLTHESQVGAKVALPPSGLGFWLWRRIGGPLQVLRLRALGQGHEVKCCR